MSPLELLEKELKEYEESLEKSKEAFTEGRIDASTHSTHHNNLDPKIQEYKEAIRILVEYLPN